MGGYDLFFTILKDDGTFSRPENMGYPINSIDDDVLKAVRHYLEKPERIGQLIERNPKIFDQYFGFIKTSKPNQLEISLLFSMAKPLLFIVDAK